MNSEALLTRRAAVVSRGVPSAADSRGADTPMQSGWSPTTPGIFSIEVDSDSSQPAGAHGSASNRGVFPFSAMGRLEHFCSTPATYPVRIRFYLDAAETPRSQPFRPPSLAVVADFTPASGGQRRIANVADSAPRYLGAGWPLAPGFGEVFAASSSHSGVLNVTATMNDPDTASTVTYSDAVACELVPCA